MRRIIRIKHDTAVLVPQILIGLFWWGLVGIMIAKVEPELVKDLVIPNSYLPFLLVVFLALYWTLWILRGSKRLALAWGGGIVGFLGLRLAGLGNWLNAGLLLGLLTAMEYWYKDEPSQTK